jgi:hypothetical protein
MESDDIINVDDIPEGKLGVGLDRSIDAAIEYEGAASALDRIVATLDTMADSRDIEPNHISELRDVQSRLATLATDFEAGADHHRERVAAIEKRLGRYDTDEE